jgi:hypothetical protein
VSSFSKLQTCIQIKIYIKVKKKHFIFIINNNNKNRKHIKIKINKKVKSFYKKLKPGDFTVAEGHGHPLVPHDGIFLFLLPIFKQLIMCIFVLNVYFLLEISCCN